MHLRRLRLRGLPPGLAVKRLLPRSLLGRSLLIILVPLVIVQAVALQIYYGSHLDLVSRRLSDAVVNEIAFTLDLMHRFPGPENRRWITEFALHRFDLRIALEPRAILENRKHPNVLGPMDDDLRAALAQTLDRPFTMDWTYDTGSVLIRVQLPEGVLDVKAPRKRLYTGTIFLFVAWLMGSALLLFGIAAAFM
ncbi:MAG: two-component sensor histidine kinase, partial [Rhodospirillales bacterium]|nr:two-component sensor histidine kinase [Rhodospirillales bacterium]